jgi:GntR family transcriptional regulator, transcriptional repressor for pyruvate dehydrogenase complex
MHLAEVSKDALTDRVIRAIKDLIWRGDVMPGDYLPSQQELAAQLGVGLSTIREAVKALSLIGLLAAHPGRGTLVLPDAMKILSNEAAMRASLGPVDYDQVLEARRVLEIALARMAAERATGADVADMEACLQEMRGATDDNSAFARADVRFHLAVARASKNEVLAQSYYFIHSLLEKVVQEADSLPEGKERALVNHRVILEGIQHGNAALVQEASERQLSDVAEQVRTGLIQVAA